MLKQMPPPSGSVGGVGSVGGMAGLGGGVFPPQLSPQHIAMLSSIYPPHIQFQLVRNEHTSLHIYSELRHTSAWSGGTCRNDLIIKVTKKLQIHKI